MRRDGFLKTLFDTTTHRSAVADTAQPFTQVQEGGVHSFSVAVGVHQTLVGKIFACRSSDRINSTGGLTIGINWRGQIYNAIVNQLLVSGRPRVGLNLQLTVQFHRGVMAHEQRAAVVLIAECCTVDKTHALFLARILTRTRRELGIFHHDLQYIRDRTPVPMRVDAARGGAVPGNTHVEQAVDPIVVVREQVSGQTRSIRPPFTPAEKVFCIERNVRCWTEKCFPVNRLRIALRMNFVLPGAIVTVAIGAGLDERYMTQHVLANDFASRKKVQRLPMLVAYLEHFPFSLYRVVQLVCLSNLVRHAFLNVHVLTRTKRVNRNGSMQVIGCCDHDSVDIRVLQQLPVIPVRPGFHAILAAHHDALVPLDIEGIAHSGYLNVLAFLLEVILQSRVIRVLRSLLFHGLDAGRRRKTQACAERSAAFTKTDNSNTYRVACHRSDCRRPAVDKVQLLQDQLFLSESFFLDRILVAALRRHADNEPAGNR